MADYDEPLETMEADIEAFAWGLLASVGLLIGAAAGMYSPIEHRGISRTMAFGAGILFAVISLDLAAAALQTAGIARTALALMGGATLFSGLNVAVSRWGARHRKRCGGCVKQPTEAGQRGSGVAIALGTMMDGIPEGVVLGLETVQHGAPGFATIAAFIIGNIPEALSSAAGMWVAGRGSVYIWSIWCSAAVVTAAAAALAATVLPDASPVALAMVKALSAGALLSMTVETLVPEAAHDTAGFNGVVTAGGFVVLAWILVLA